MPLDLKQLADPGHTALITQECQRGVMGDLSQLPELASAAKAILPNSERPICSALFVTGHLNYFRCKQVPATTHGFDQGRVFEFLA